MEPQKMRDMERGLADSASAVLGQQQDQFEAAVGVRAVSGDLPDGVVSALRRLQTQGAQRAWVAARVRANAPTLGDRDTVGRAFAAWTFGGGKSLREWWVRRSMRRLIHPRTSVDRRQRSEQLRHWVGILTDPQVVERGQDGHHRFLSRLSAAGMLGVQEWDPVGLTVAAGKVAVDDTQAREAVRQHFSSMSGGVA